MKITKDQLKQIIKEELKKLRKCGRPSRSNLLLISHKTCNLAR